MAIAALITTACESPGWDEGPARAHHTAPAPHVRAAAPVKAGPPDDLAVKVQNGACLDGCSTHTLSIDRFGHIFVDGLPSTGRGAAGVGHRANLDKADRVRIWEAVVASRFEELPAVIPQTELCVTCQSTDTLTVHAEGREHSVTFDNGCSDAATTGLQRLSAVIERVSRHPGEGDDWWQWTPEALKSQVRRVSANKFSVPRTVLKDLLRDPEAAARGARLIIRDDDSNPVLIYGVRRESLPGLLGLQNGDRIASFNGQRVQTLQDISRVALLATTLDRAEVSIVRRGHQEQLFYDIY